MMLHGNAALTPKKRLLMARRVVEQGWSLTEAAAAASVSERTARKWVSGFRITDKANGGIGSGTVIDLPVQFNVPCATTTATDIGSTCSIDTSVNTLFGATAIADTKRSIWQQTELVKLYDRGGDGVAATGGDNTLFATGGVFVP